MYVYIYCIYNRLCAYCNNLMFQFVYMSYYIFDLFHMHIYTFSQDLNAKAEAYIKLICKAENEYQASLNESYVELSENTFKGLRRALPLTRHKLDWDKVFDILFIFKMEK